MQSPQTITIPMEVPVMTMKSDNREALDGLYHRLCTDFGEASGLMIIRTITEELGGLRVSFPDLQDLEREERDRRLVALFTGNNYKELAERFTSPRGGHLSSRQVRNIINEKRRKRQ
jgi:Mor family transcriptional regulator